MLRSSIVVAALAGAALMAAGCGSSKKSSSAGSTTAGPARGGQSAGALSAEAKSAATGDIPDNQVFLIFHDTAGGYSMKYPEGWTQRGSGADVTFKNNNNLVHIVVANGGAATPASVAAQLRALKASDSTLEFQTPRSITLGGSQAVKVTYTTTSAPNPVTGKRVTLIVDRYELAKAGKHAVVDLGTPTGVDNFDAYRLMIQSFRWR
jgi:PsbP